jgi:hypothetical protein
LQIRSSTGSQELPASKKQKAAPEEEQQEEEKSQEEEKVQDIQDEEQESQLAGDAGGSGKKDGTLTYLEAVQTQGAAAKRYLTLMQFWKLWRVVSH